MLKGTTTPPAPSDDNIAPEPTGSRRSGRRRRGQRRPLVLIDPAPLTRQALEEMFAKGLPEFVIVAASGWDELLQIPGGPPTSPALVLIDTKSAKVADDWIQSTLDLVRRHLRDVPVVLLSDLDSADEVVSALSWGVRGYVTTSIEAEVAFAALRLVDAGGTFIPAHGFSAATGNSRNGSNGEHQGPIPGIDLTPREMSVIDLLRQGMPNKVIGVNLQMQESTVKVHLRNIMKKLRVTNRTHAVSVANRLFAQQQALTALDLPVPQVPNGRAGIIPLG
jgi:DNA-binding NarL/FixJ family response regulator